MRVLRLLRTSPKGRREAPSDQARDPGLGVGAKPGHDQTQACPKEVQVSGLPSFPGNIDFFILLQMGRIERLFPLVYFFSVC